MTNEELAVKMQEIATATGVEVTYFEWPKGAAPAPPYIVWYLPESRDLIADNEVYLSISELVIELYTARKDPVLEWKLEAAIKAAGFVCTKEETYIDTEKVYEEIYTTEVIIDE